MPRGEWQFLYGRRKPQSSSIQLGICSGSPQTEGEGLLGNAKCRKLGPPPMKDGVDYINVGEEDQMEIVGYRQDPCLTILTWCGIVCTAGFLRLLFHWHPSWMLRCTHRRCRLSHATRVLLADQYKQVFVEKVKTVFPSTVDTAPMLSVTGKSDYAYGGPITLQTLVTMKSAGILESTDRIKFFENNKIKYIWDPEHQTFVRLRGLDKNIQCSYFHQQKGIPVQEQVVRRVLYGDNAINVTIDSVFRILFREVLEPFYVFQVFSMAIWYSDHYYYYASCIIVMSALSLITGVYQIRSNQKALHSTVHGTDIVTVRRLDGLLETIPSEHLVPGDVIVIPRRGCLMQCDAVLIAGNCIVNESMLTGESVPVVKTPLPHTGSVGSSRPYNPKEHARHTLFCGTKVIQTRFYGNENVEAVVVRTGFLTAKGELVRSIMFPKPVDFKFNRHITYFLLFLGGLASIGVVYTIVLKSFRGVPVDQIIIRALDVVTIVIPPALPAAMTIGIVFAQQRLRRALVYCISPRSINTSGSINCFCFDKTGTLTEDGLDLWGIVPASDGKFQKEIQDTSGLALDSPLLLGMATCHSLTMIDRQLSGDPLDLKMFKATGWVLEEPDVDDSAKYDIITPTVVRPNKKRRPSAGDSTVNDASKCENIEVGTVRELPFSSSMQRMSVVTRLLGSTHFDVFCKGAPETITSLCKPDTVPLDFGVAFVLQKADRSHGIASSPLLFTFWLLLSICDLPAYYRILQYAFGQAHHEPPSLAEYTDHGVTYPVIVCQLFLFSLGESTGKHRWKRECPVEHASPMSYLIFEWLTPLVWTGYKKVLALQDLYIIPRSLKASANYELFRDASKIQEGQRRNPFIVKALLRIFWAQILLGCVVELCFILLRVTPAVLLDRIIKHLQSDDEEMWKGYLYAVSIFVLNSLSTMFVRHGDTIFISLGLRVKAVLTAAVYRKTIRVSGATMSKYTVGELINMLSVDADKVNQLSSYIGIAVGAPVNIAYSTYLLWHFLGPSCLAGIAVILIMMPITGAIAQRCRTLQEQQMSQKDSRLKQLGEMLGNIRILKLYAWELPFINKVRGVRFSEVEILKRFAYWTATMRFSWTSTPFLVSLFAFTAFVFSEHVTVLDASVAFVSLTLFNGMRFALSIIPDLVSNVVQTTVSIRRIEEFLMGEELDPYVVGRSVGDNEAVSFNDATLSWSGSDYIALADVNLSVKKGQLLAVVGQVGSGKSSLLSAMLGDMLLEKGTVDVEGSIAYVPQSAWILNSTFKQNILFARHFSHSLYNKVLDTCCLRPDLKTIPGGEMTEIGEKGVNLSGGQKQRISLARAVYQDKDIYLLDDPLSAVDSHVGAAIFKDVIGPKGMLRRKTRILVTNNLSVLSEVDSVVYMQGGRIVESGTYADLVRSGRHFSRFVKEHVAVALDGTSEEEEDNKQVVRQRTISELQLERSRSETLRAADKRPEFHLLQEETVESGGVKAGIYLTYLKNVGAPLILATLTGFGASRAFDIGANLWLSDWNGDLLVPEVERRPGFRLGIYAVLGICQGVFSFVGTAALANGTVRASRRLHDRMLGAVVRAPMSFFDTTPLGRILNRFGKDVDQLDIQLPVMANLFLELLFQLFGVLMLMASQMPLFLVGAVPLLYFYFLIQQIYLQTLRQIKRLESVTRSPVYNHYSETIAGVSSVRAYAVENEFTERFFAKVDTTQNCSYLLVIARMWMTARLDTIGNIVVLLVTAMVISQRGTIDDGLGGLLVSYVMASCFAFNFLIHYASEMETAVVASERLDEYSKVAPEAPWRVHPAPERAWPQQGAVTFRNYSTRYREGLDLVLRGVDLAIKPGERVGVVGRTGAGKSSLTLSLFRIIESADGEIRIDGRDIASVGLHDLRTHLSIIPQDPVLFSGTLRFNLDPNGEYGDSELWSALERAHVKDHFPEGLETRIHEGGHNISLGERQLVCLARAVLKKTKILVLDEATAAVDLETDSLVQDTIAKCFVGCTTITIAHRLHTIMDSDRIVVMANGRVIEEGSPTDLLLDQSSEFASMAREAGIAP